MIFNNLKNAGAFLLNNKSVGQTIFKNTFWITLSGGLSKILRAILIIYTARFLGAAEYGKFNFALAFVSVFVTFFDLGLSSIITREFSRDKEREKEFSSLISLKILLGFGSVVLIGISSYFITSDPAIQKIIWILAIFAFISQFPEIFYSFLRARQKMEYEAWANILQAVLIVVIGLTVLFYAPTVKNISYGYLFGSLISLIPFLIFFQFRIFSLKLSFGVGVWKKFLLASWPLALASIFGLLYGYIDSIIMGHLGQITQTGWYNAALKIINIALVPASIISICFYPVLSKFNKESKDNFQRAYDYQMLIMIFLAVPVLIFGLVFASQIIELIYGKAFLPAILALQILIVMAAISFISSPFSQILIVADQQKKTFYIFLFGAVINIISNIILIPKFSLYGAAVSGVITYFLTLILCFAVVAKFTSIKPLNLNFLFGLVSGIFAGLALYLIVSWPKIYNLNILLSFLIGGIIYSIIFLVLIKTLRPQLKIIKII